MFISCTKSIMGLLCSDFLIRPTPLDCITVKIGLKLTPSGLKNRFALFVGQEMLSDLHSLDFAGGSSRNKVGHKYFLRDFKGRHLLFTIIDNVLLCDSFALDWYYSSTDDFSVFLIRSSEENCLGYLWMGLRDEIKNFHEYIRSKYCPILQGRSSLHLC